MATILKKGPDRGPLPPGQWRVHDLDDPNPSVFVSCPKCGLLGILNHWIEPDGKIRPSLECPVKECFHEDGVILADWTPPAPGVTLSPEGP